MASALYQSACPTILVVVIFAYFFYFIFIQSITKKLVHTKQIKLRGLDRLSRLQLVQVFN
jgi:hypothetical protein